MRVVTRNRQEKQNGRSLRLEGMPAASVHNKLTIHVIVWASFVCNIHIQNEAKSAYPTA